MHSIGSRDHDAEGMDLCACFRSCPDMRITPTRLHLYAPPHTPHLVATSCTCSRHDVNADRATARGAAHCRHTLARGRAFTAHSRCTTSKQAGRLPLPPTTAPRHLGRMSRRFACQSPGRSVRRRQQTVRVCLTGGPSGWTNGRRRTRLGCSLGARGTRTQDFARAGTTAAMTAAWRTPLGKGRALPL
jgi:hypothetical protein